MRPDGKLWIVPLEGGEARLLSCSLPVMNSWHSFSPNGRWLVFSSKTNTPYTQMFLSHLDENGYSSPAVLIENATVSNRAVNIPEFVNIEFDAFKKIDLPAVDHWRHFIRGAALSEEGNHTAAVEEYRLSLEGEQHDWRSNDWKTHSNMSVSLMELGDVDGALEHIQASLRLHPDNPEMYTNYGFLLLQKGVPLEALSHLDKAVRLGPKEPTAWFNRATVRMNLGDNHGALADYDQAILLDSDLVEAYNGRGMIRKGGGDLDGALADFSMAIRLDPAIPTAWYFRATIRREQGDLAGAKSDLQEALKVMARSDGHRRSVKSLLVQVQAEMGE
jgi:tetratricopeptide (TPR) repeat protein